ncbi:methionine ABC transporter permease [Bisgaard Taxon 45]
MFDQLWADFTQEMTPRIWELVSLSTLETLYMGFIATLFAIVVGLPIGLFAFLTGKGEILEHRRANQVLNVIINIGRSVPFIILLIILLPFTRLVVGTTLGTTAAIVPLSVSAIPFFARLTANALLEIPSGLTEAAKSMGATNWQIVTKYYLPESIPILINGITLTLVALIGYSAMAGAVGGGGLGNLAITYGEHRNMVYVKWIATIIIVLIVMLSQKLGDHLAERFDHR